MLGPAVYPITPPATRPTGPATMAPEAAPSAASTARSPAMAAAGANSAEAANTIAIICLIFALRRMLAGQASAARHCSVSVYNFRVAKWFTARLHSPCQAAADKPPAPQGHA